MAASIRVVIVDDNPLFAEALELSLRHEPRVEVVGRAEDGLAALELAVSVEPDVVLMDVEMPVLDGIEATRRLRALAPGIVVVVVSGDDPGVASARARAAGAEAFVGKHRPLKEVVDTVVRAYEVGRPHDLRSPLARTA